jgi:hypothetical protein
MQQVTFHFSFHRYPLCSLDSFRRGLTKTGIYTHKVLVYTFYGLDDFAFSPKDQLL